MPEDIYSKLLSSIESDRVVMLCGAGLSMSPPSNMPSAKILSNQCYDRYETITGTKLDPPLRDNLEELAKYFIEESRYQDFINNLVPWINFRHNPNNGHEAIADFLECNIIEFVVSTNYDTFIEDAARNLGENDFRATIDASKIPAMGLMHKPLLKIHGCCLLERQDTVWHRDQLLIERFKTRISNAKTWLETNLKEKHLVFIGFWTDWYYLNTILEDCVSNIEPQLVVLVNPSNRSELESKAPALFKWAKSKNFHHEPTTSDFFLEELRRRFSLQFLKEIIDRSKESYEREFSKITSTTLLEDNISTKDTYNLRRYFCGMPNCSPVKNKRPDGTQQLIGIYHIYLIEKGAQLEEIIYKINGKRIRMINGAGKFISAIKIEFEKDNFFGVDLTLCVGAEDVAAPSSIFRTSTTSTVVRSKDTSKWITHKTLNNELGF